MLYNQIRANKRKTTILIASFFALVVATGWAIGYFAFGDMFSGTIIAIVVLAFHIPISYYTAGKQVMRMSGAREVTHDEYPELYNIVKELTIPARLPMPKVYVVNDSAPNAFASGISPDKSNVAVTTGLLEILDREELEGVIAHELAHIQNLDIRLMSLSISLVSVIILIADIGTRIMFFGGSKSKDDNRNPVLMIIALALIILAPLLGQMMKLMVSRNREYLADATAVDLTRNPEGLKGALAKIGGANLSVKNAKPATAGMYISSPFKTEKSGGGLSFLENLMSTHPPIESRIEKLNEM